jgi:alpha-beta hydrolase superfamily lysophospholipase
MERYYAAKEEDLLPFYSQLSTHDKEYVLLPDGGHALMLEKDHRRFQHEVLSFFDRPRSGRRRLPRIPAG